MKKITLKTVVNLYLTAAMLLPSMLFAQTKQQNHRCGTTEHMNYLKQNDSGMEQRLLLAEQTLQQWIANNPNFRRSNVVDTIPVVVHVVYKTPVQNISDAQVFSQIDVLNEDYARRNADSLNTPAVWRPISGTMPYQFVLARQDPFGNPTNGIVRKLTTVNSFSLNDAVKFDNQGGDDAWDVTTYLNIWVCNLGGGILGYAEYPTSTPSNTFGFVCEYNSFGRVGSVTPPYNLGRTTTHEIGHCFSLYHIWGNDFSDCTGSDQVGDTPNQEEANYGCMSFPHLDSCTTVSPGVMYMNYMDYGDDDCLNMFTEGQTTRMTGAINNFYPGIVNSIGKEPGTLLSNNAALTNITSPTGTVCNTSISPVVEIVNWGSSTLTSVNINYSIDGGTVNTYAWSGSLSLNSIASVILPSINVSAGLHILTSFTSMPNGVVDSSNSGDTSSVSFNVNNTIIAFPLAEEFQGTFPPVSWTYSVVNNTNKWSKKNGAGGFGLSTACAKMDNLSGSTDVSGQIDDMIAPMVDISSVLGGLKLSFSVAYAQYNSSSVDSLVVLAEGECSGNIQRMYVKGGSTLKTVAPQTAAFTPTAVQWRTDSVNLSSYLGQSSLKITFRSVSDWGNNLYVDDINFSLPTGIDDITEGSLLLYPNPASDEIILVTNFINSNNYELQVTDVLGKTENIHSVREGQKIVINTSHLADGVYFINILSDKKSLVKKIVISR